MELMPINEAGIWDFEVKFHSFGFRNVVRYFVRI